MCRIRLWWKNTMITDLRRFESFVLHEIQICRARSAMYFGWRWAFKAPLHRWPNTLQWPVVTLDVMRGKLLTTEASSVLSLPTLVRWTNELAPAFGQLLTSYRKSSKSNFYVIFHPPSSLLAFDSSETKQGRNLTIAMDTETKNVIVSGAQFVSVSQGDVFVHCAMRWLGLFRGSCIESQFWVIDPILLIFPI